MPLYKQKPRKLVKRSYKLVKKSTPIKRKYTPSYVSSRYHKHKHTHHKHHHHRYHAHARHHHMSRAHYDATLKSSYEKVKFHLFVPIGKIANFNS